MLCLQSHFNYRNAVQKNTLSGNFELVLQALATRNRLSNMTYHKLYTSKYLGKIVPGIKKGGGRVSVPSPYTNCLS